MPTELCDAIRAAGVVGAGGGGFPTHVKAATEADTLLANGAECEPLLRSDSAVMRAAPERVLAGISLMREAIGADRAVLAVKRKNLADIEELIAGVEASSDIELNVLDNVYPSGDEYLLVHEATGRVVPEGGIPPDVSVVVSNVTTLAQVAEAREGRPVTRRFVTVHGAVARPGTVVARVGTRLADLVEAAGGATCEPSAIIAGGPMMGRLADLNEPTVKTTAGIIVLPESHLLVTSRRETVSHALRIARAACCQCMACTELCPRALLGHDLAPHRTIRAIQYGLESTEHPHVTSAYLCCECGMCELFACPLEIRPRRILAELKAELARRGVENPHTKKELDPSSVRAYRQIPTSRLVQRLGLARYDAPAPPEPEPLAVDRVRLRLSQHVGAAAEPVVREGDAVLEGDVVGEIPPGALGARVHASISGTVTGVTSDSIIIEHRPEQRSASR